MCCLRQNAHTLVDVAVAVYALRSLSVRRTWCDYFLIESNNTTHSARARFVYVCEHVLYTVYRARTYDSCVFAPPLEYSNASRYTRANRVRTHRTERRRRPSWPSPQYCAACTAVLRVQFGAADCTINVWRVSRDDHVRNEWRAKSADHARTRTNTSTRCRTGTRTLALLNTPGRRVCV